MGKRGNMISATRKVLTNTEERVKRLRDDGKTGTQIANELRISRCRVYQILKAIQMVTSRADAEVSRG